MLLFGVLIAYGIFLIAERSHQLAGVVIVLSAVPYLSVITWRQLVFPKTLYKKDPSLKEEITITFSEEEVIYQTAHEPFSLTWDRYLAFKETRDFIYLYIFNKTLTVIPKRAFDRKEDQQKLIGLLESKLKKKK